MNRSDFLKLLDELQIKEKDINITKGKEYADGDEDALLNFKRTARDVGITPLQVLAVFMHKHFDSIMRYTKMGYSESEEPIAGRIADLRLYAALGLALIEEERT